MLAAFEECCDIRFVGFENLVDVVARHNLIKDSFVGQQLDVVLSFPIVWVQFAEGAGDDEAELERAKLAPISDDEIYAAARLQR